MEEAARQQCRWDRRMAQKDPSWGQGRVLRSTTRLRSPPPAVCSVVLPSRTLGGKRWRGKQIKLNCLDRLPSSPLAPRFMKYLMSTTRPLPLAGRTLPTPVYTQRTRGRTVSSTDRRCSSFSFEGHFRKLFSGMNKVRLRSFLPDPSSSK